MIVMLRVHLALLLTVGLLMPRAMERCCDKGVGAASAAAAGDCCNSCGVESLTFDADVAQVAPHDGADDDESLPAPPGPVRCGQCTANCCAKVVLAVGPLGGSTLPATVHGLITSAQLAPNDRSLADVFHPPRA
jgi:hypothetical protein